MSTTGSRAESVELLAAAAGTGRGSFALVALIVAVISFVLVSGMAQAFQAALAVAADVFGAMVRTAGIGVVAIVVLGLLLFL